MLIGNKNILSRNGEVFFDSDFGMLKLEKLLGKGKSGYSFLTSCENRNYILKLMHDEEISYYDFTDNKVKLELNSYELLSKLNIRIPQLYYYNVNKNYLIKEYIKGLTGAEWVALHGNSGNIIKQLFEVSSRCKKDNLNIDFFPSNFVIKGEKLFYIDYEANPYSEEWSLENWGIYYWANMEGMKKYLDSKDICYLNQDLINGIPIKKNLEEKVNLWIEKYSKF